ncbi:hypothetical protein HYDPIDRAFT_38547 [Hydnomerulius pinastri MD-312]|nr:hypothetical protein HYDPIDRAFT_38547 [Hydnomerulius pinastri MD-312]
MAEERRTQLWVSVREERGCPVGSSSGWKNLPALEAEFVSLPGLRTKHKSYVRLRKIRVFFKSIALNALGLFAGSAAACNLSERHDGFEFYFYEETNCGTGNGYKQFYGSGRNPLCDCYNLKSTINDKVKLFTYTASNQHLLEIYETADCKGASRGT